MATILTFGLFRLDAEAEILFRGAEPLPLGRRAVALLRALVERPREPVSKHTLIEAAWAGLAVEESNLPVQIAALRKVLGEEPGGEHWIETLSRRGYRLVGPAVTKREVGVFATTMAESHAKLSSTIALALPDKPSVAVLPFQNLSGDPGQEYFADGMVEEITAALSRVKSFFVIARNSSFTYKGRAVDVKQVGGELGVRYVLEGSVRKAGKRVRITAQLIDATNGNHIWSDRYEGSIEEIFDLQDRVSESVVGTIQPSILLAEIKRTKRKPPESLDAYDCVLRALPHVWAFNSTANASALNYLNRAIEIEPDYPLALSILAWCQTRQVTYMWTSMPNEAKAEGLRIAKVAGDLNNDDPMVLTMLSAAHAIIASALIEKALVLDPNSAFAWNRSGFINVLLNRPEVAIGHQQKAIRLSPFDPMKFNYFLVMGLAHFAAERYEETLYWHKKGILERPEYTWPLALIASCLGHLERISEAREVVRQLRLAYPDITISKRMATAPFRDGDFLRRYAEGLRKAGLPA